MRHWVWVLGRDLGGGLLPGHGHVLSSHVLSKRVKITNDKHTYGTTDLRRREDSGYKMPERCSYLLQLGYLLGNLSSCWWYYDSLQQYCFQCFPNAIWRCCLEEGPSELEAEVEEGVYDMRLVRGKAVSRLVVEERLAEDEHVK